MQFPVLINKNHLKRWKRKRQSPPNWMSHGLHDFWNVCHKLLTSRKQFSWYQEAECLGGGDKGGLQAASMTSWNNIQRDFVFSGPLVWNVGASLYSVPTFKEGISGCLLSQYSLRTTYENIQAAICRHWNIENIKHFIYWFWNFLYINIHEVLMPFPNTGLQLFASFSNRLLISLWSLQSIPLRVLYQFCDMRL